MAVVRSQMKACVSQYQRKIEQSRLALMTSEIMSVRMYKLSAASEDQW